MQGPGLAGGLPKSKITTRIPNHIQLPKIYWMILEGYLDAITINTHSLLKSTESISSLKQLPNMYPMFYTASGIYNHLKDFWVEGIKFILKNKNKWLVYSNLLWFLRYLRLLSHKLKFIHYLHADPCDQWATTGTRDRRIGSSRRRRERKYSLKGISNFYEILFLSSHFICFYLLSVDNMCK